MAVTEKSTEPGTDFDTLEKKQEEIKKPTKYVVVLHNDDFTTQEFVVHVLCNFFHKDPVLAHRLMLKVHVEGKARIGSFTKDLAQSKVALVTSYARENQMPLRLSVEPE